MTTQITATATEKHSTQLTAPSILDGEGHRPGVEITVFGPLQEYPAAGADVELAGRNIDRPQWAKAHPNVIRKTTRQRRQRRKSRTAEDSQGFGSLPYQGFLPVVAPSSCHAPDPRPSTIVRFCCPQQRHTHARLRSHLSDAAESNAVHDDSAVKRARANLIVQINGQMCCTYCAEICSSNRINEAHHLGTKCLTRGHILYILV